MDDMSDRNISHQEIFHVECPGFDAEYYLNTYPDIRDAGVDPLQHFLGGGWKEGRNPSAGFNVKAYLARYPDVAESGQNPLIHYLNYGLAEGRKALPADLSKHFRWLNK